MNEITVTVERSKWLRGKGSEVSALLFPPKYSGKLDRSDVLGKKCCLGFACNAMGFHDEDILGVGDPSELYDDVADIPAGHDIMRLVKQANEFGGTAPTEVTTQMMIVNDDEKITDAEREPKLIELAQQINMRLVFVD